MPHRAKRFDADHMGAYYDDIRAAYIEDTQNATDQIANESGQAESEPSPQALGQDEGEVRVLSEETILSRAGWQFSLSR